MPRDVGRSARRAATTAGLTLVGVLAAPAAAGAVAVNLHVEAGGRVLAPGDGQVARTISTPTTQNARCMGSGRPAPITGATPMGALVAAQDWRPQLKPIEISDQFSFGLFLCSAGGYFGSSDAFWLYKVNHVSPEVGGDSFKVHTGDDVLWFFENTETGENTGDELAIDAPARARPGEPVDVTVSAYSFDGKRKPAAAATVVAGSGGRTTSDGGGRARVSFSQQGYLKLRASLGSDIPSPVLKVCVSARLARCAPVRGKRIYGTGLSDRVRGTAGRDVVRTGAGDDVINVRGGRLDRVFCGRGTDLVRASRKDHVASDCEEVRRR